MTIRSTAGSTLGVSAAAPATANEAGYAALTFTNVGKITNLGEFGKTFNLITFNSIDDRGTEKLKGSFNEGAIALNIGLDDDDAGQEILEGAVEVDDKFYFRITLQSGTVFYFPALVMSFPINAGGVDDVTSATVNLEITRLNGTGIIKVPVVGS